MATLIRERSIEDHLRAERKANGLDRWDEVWEGVYVMPPYPNNEHQFLQTRLTTILDLVVGLQGKGEVLAGANVSDRIEGWTHNYRCPDVAVFLKGNRAENHETFWFGGPDFAVEIVSPDDASRDKLEFYASVGVRELLIVDRAPWKLELYRLQGKSLVDVGNSVLPKPATLRSEVVPLSFRLVAGGPRPSVEVTHDDGVQHWTA
jgi:Uma2 family endonuclease